jgi:hypothetical protein
MVIKPFSRRTIFHFVLSANISPFYRIDEHFSILSYRRTFLYFVISTNIPYFVISTNISLFCHFDERSEEKSYFETRSTLRFLLTEYHFVALCFAITSLTLSAHRSAVRTLTAYRVDARSDTCPGLAARNDSLFCHPEPIPMLFGDRLRIWFSYSISAQIPPSTRLPVPMGFAGDEETERNSITTTPACEGGG